MHLNVSLFNTSRRAGYRARGVRGCRRRGEARPQKLLPLRRPLEDRLDPYWNGRKFPAMTSRRAQLAAWKHAERIVNREADHGFDYSA